MKLYVVTRGNAQYADKVRAAGGIPVDGVPAEAVPLKDARAGSIVKGPLDRAALQKAAALGIGGVVLDAALLLLPESHLSDADKAALPRLSQADFASGEATLPSGLKVGRDALLATFTARRSPSLAAALQQAQQDLGAVASAPPAPPAPTPPPAPPLPAAAPAAPRADVLTKLTALVSEKTGYPADVLDPDLDMEADLGIDTVKQAELFGLLREHYSLPRDDSIQLKDYPTLRKVAGYISGRLGQEPAAAPPAPPPQPAPAPVARAPPAQAPPVAAASAQTFETQPPEEAVAIIGMGAVLPKANSAREFWRNVLEKRDCITEVPPERWDARVHYDPDPNAPDKTYAKIGAFVTDFKFDSLKFRIPPSVAKALDPIQQMVLAAAAEALQDGGYEQKPFDRARCAVILGNALGGEQRDITNKRIYVREFMASLAGTAEFKSLPPEQQKAMLARAQADFTKHIPAITEDTMPGELSNVIAGRVANVLNLGGKNLTTDAACASSHAAIDTAVKAILGGEADMVLCGGADRTMDPATYIKFAKIGALSARGSSPFDARADGFVMGEGAAIFLLKRLSDAIRDGDRVYCVIRGMGSSSDGKGKGITAPNPVGQKLAVERAFRTAEILPKHVQLVEAHGTSTKVGDVVEVESISTLFQGVPVGSVALGSVKSQIGHLKSAAGAAGVLKAAMALHEKTLPPSINFQTPNPSIKWSEVPFYVNTDAKPWPATANGEPRRAAVSAFGFGGTNFHVILEEFVPGYHGRKRAAPAPIAAPAPAPLVEGELVVLGADSIEGLSAAAASAKAAVAQHATLANAVAAINTPRHHLKGHRVAGGATNRAELEAALGGIAELLKTPQGRMALPLKVRGAAYGEGPRPAGKVAFLFPGQGSQYANMCYQLAQRYPVVRATFEEADRVLEPLLGAKLTSLVFCDPKDKAALARAEEALKQTEVTQPAMLAADVAIFRLLGEHGVKPDMVAGHSLGEYAALVAAGVLSFEDALIAVSARGKEMANVHVPDKGLMASFSCGPEQAEEILRGVQGYVVAANKNCPVQTVVAGDTPSVKKAVELASAKGVETMLLPVSAAFHTSIVAPASAPLRKVLDRLTFRAPQTTVFTNVDATPYPGDPNAIRDILSKQVAAPVEWVKELNAMYDAGARVFIEVGPKRALAGFVDATFSKTKPDVVSLLTNHPKTGDLPTYYAALAKLAALGFELRIAAAEAAPQPQPAPSPVPHIVHAHPTATPAHHYEAFRAHVMPSIEAAMQQGFAKLQAELARVQEASAAFEKYGLVPADIVVSGAAMGLPGQARRVFADDNHERLFAGENRIDRLDAKWAAKFIEKELVRLVKDAGEPRMEPVTDPKEVLKLAGRRGDLDVERDYGVPAKLVKTLDVTSKLAIAAAYEALHDAGIPMVRETIVTTTGKTLPGDWVLPPHLQDDTGIVFASAFPGYDNLVHEVSLHLARRFSKKTLTELDALYHEMLDAVPPEKKGRVSEFYARHAGELHRMVGDKDKLEAFNRHFLFSVLSLGHAELAELIVARGPNTQVNAACSSSTQAVAIAEDWIRTGRARRVLVVGADDVTSENLLEWIGSGFLVSGAATTAGSVEEGALPFDKRRHGMIIGMGAVGLVLEKREDVEARGMVPVARLVATKIANSAYHGSRLHVEHIAKEASDLVRTAAKRLGRPVEELGGDTIFVSHETYTPARGGSASAEAAAMRAAFGASARQVLITNTKGFTGHPMGAGIEDALAVKALQFNRAPPIANLKEIDPDFADLSLSRGGEHHRKYAMRFSAGFGSQLAMAFFEKMADGAQRVKDAARYQAFLDQCAGSPAAKAERVGRVYKITNVAMAPTQVPVTTKAPEPIATPAAPAPKLVPVQVAEPARMDAGVPTMGREEVLKKVVALVAEKSGYPPEMLDPNLDMEADLGIDTVKQAEVFGQLREAFAIPREEGLTLKDYPTLSKVADYMHSRLAMTGSTPAPQSPPMEPARVAEAPKPQTPVPAPVSVPAAEDIQAKIVAIVGQRTGYPPEMLDPTLDMEADLGIDTVKQAEMFAEIRETFGIPRIEGINLKDYPTISHVAGFVQTHAGRAPAAQQQASAAPQATANAPQAQGVARRVPRVVEAPAVGHMNRTAFSVGHGDLAEALRHHYHHTSGDIAVFVGSPKELFLFAKQNAAKLEAGQLGILAVTHLGGEHGIPVKPEPRNPEEGGVTGMAKALAAEFPKAWVRALDLDPDEDVAARARHVLDELKIEKSSVEVGRRGSRRVAVRTILAGGTGPERPQLPQGAVLVVTGGARGITAEVLKALAPQKPTLVLLGRTDAPTDADLAFDEAALRERAKADLQAKGQKVTPVNIEKWVAPHRARHEVAKSLRDLRAAGATVDYKACDVTDAPALAQALAPYKGKITGIIHAAGVEESKRLADKDEGAFDRAWKPKAEAAMRLADATKGERLKLFVMFGSVAGRYGNAAQADYSAANDAMAKLARKLRAHGVPASVFCWGPWGETGMATRGSTLTVLSAAGVEPISTKEGVDAFLYELARLDEPEVVLAKSLGALEAAHAHHEPEPYKRTLDARVPELDHHRVDGVPYLAGVLGLQAFAQGASVEPTGFEDVRFGYPVKLLRDEPVEITVHVDSVGNAKLTSVPKGPVKQEKVHFTGAILTAPHPAPQPRPFDGAPWAFGRVYPPFFHGPAFQVLKRATRVSLDGIEVEGAPGGISKLYGTIEGALQALGLWGLAVARRMALPERIGKVVWHTAAPDTGRTTYRVFRARHADDRIQGDVECLIDGKVAVSLTDVALVVTGPAPLDLETPQAWRSDDVKIGEGTVVRVPVEEARRLLASGLLSTWLGPAEQGALAKLDVPKRREEWLAATLAGKAALRRAGDDRPWTRMEVLRGDDGAPLAHDFRGLTLGHAAGVAVARVFDATRERVGVDVEAIEPRSRAFEEEAFTPEERKLFPEGDARPAAVTLAWCAKEAVLKALGLGLSADLHSVKALVKGEKVEIDLSGKPKQRFVELDGHSLAVATRLGDASWSSASPAVAVDGHATALATVTLVRRSAP